MNAFHQRLSQEDCAEIWREVNASGLLDQSTRSVIVHDLDRMRLRIGMLRETFPPRTLHALAIKANPLVEVLREAAGAGAGLEAASFEELQLAIAAGCQPDEIVFDSPAKTDREIAAALALGVLLNANDLAELDRIDRQLCERQSASRIGLRINPELGAGRIALTSVAQSGSKFGVPIRSRRPEVLAAFDRYPWLSGLHVHVGSQGCELELLVEAITVVDALRQEIEARRGRPLSFVDIGGGLPAIYVEGQTAPSPSEYVDRLRQRVPQLFASDATWVTEFGRSVQAGCGVTFSRIESVRDEPPLAVTHVGADLLMRPVYRPEDWPHEFALLDRHGTPKRGKPRPVTIAGPLCFSGDVLARDLPLPPVEVGDWVVIRDTGAYTLGMWSRHCSRGIPLVLGYDRAAACPVRVIREAETPRDIVRFWSRSPSAMPEGTTCAAPFGQLDTSTPISESSRIG